jgi:hypothetical protein
MREGAGIFRFRRWSDGISSVAVQRLPMRINLRGLGLYAEDLSRRDSVKVAQYPAAAGLGNDVKRRVRPARDDRNVRLLGSQAAQRLPALVDRPVRDG